jgi:hypothetical protein
MTPCFWCFSNHSCHISSWVDEVAYFFHSLQLETNQPINHCVHRHVPESRIFPHSIEPECLLLCLQDRSFLRTIQFNIVLQCAPGISKWSLYFRFSGLNLYAFIFTTQDTGLRPSDDRVHCHIWQELQTMKILSVVIFLLSSLFSKIPSLCSSLSASGNVLYHMKRHKKIMFFNIYCGLLSFLITGCRRNLSWRSGKHIPILIFIFFMNGKGKGTP